MTDTSKEAVVRYYMYYDYGGGGIIARKNDIGGWVEYLDYKALAAERDALQAENHTLTGERNKARQEKFKLQTKLGVATEALSKISVRMELTGDELQRISSQALSAINGGAP